METIVFQFSEEKIAKSNYINEDTILSVDNRSCKNCRALAEEERTRRVLWLVDQFLPSGMFTVVDAHTIRYEGGMNKFNEAFICQINHRTKEAGKNIEYLYDSVKDLEEYMLYPLGTGVSFYICGSNYDVAPDRQLDFMWWVNTIDEGTLLHIGNVVVCEY